MKRFRKGFSYTLPLSKAVKGLLSFQHIQLAIDRSTDACLKWMLPELSFSDCWSWSRGTKLWERDCNFPKLARTRLVFWEKCELIFHSSGYCSCFWPRGSEYSSSFCGARFNGFTLRSYTSIERSQSSLLLWVVVALKGVFLLRSQIGAAFSAQISSFVAWTEWNHPPFWILLWHFLTLLQLLLVCGRLLYYWGTFISLLVRL